jgi:hypothetical protein
MRANCVNYGKPKFPLPADDKGRNRERNPRDGNRGRERDRTSQKSFREKAPRDTNFRESERGNRRGKRNRDSDYDNRRHSDKNRSEDNRGSDQRTSAARSRDDRGRDGHSGSGRAKGSSGECTYCKANDRNAYHKESECHFTHACKACNEYGHKARWCKKTPDDTQRQPSVAQPRTPCRSCGSTNAEHASSTALGKACANATCQHCTERDGHANNSHHTWAACTENPRVNN